MYALWQIHSLQCSFDAIPSDERLKLPVVGSADHDAPFTMTCQRGYSTTIPRLRLLLPTMTGDRSHRSPSKLDAREHPQSVVGSQSYHPFLSSSPGARHVRSHAALMLLIDNGGCRPQGRLDGNPCRALFIPTESGSGECLRSGISSCNMTCTVPHFRYFPVPGCAILDSGYLFLFSNLDPCRLRDCAY